MRMGEWFLGFCSKHEIRIDSDDVLGFFDALQEERELASVSKEKAPEANAPEAD